MLHTQVKKAQNYTAVFVYKKNLQRKVLTALKLHLGYNMREKFKYDQAVQFERIKLLTTGFKTFQWYKNKNKAQYQMSIKIESVYNHLARKRGFRTFRKNCLLLKEQK